MSEEKAENINLKNMGIYDRLAAIQSELFVPKGQRNNFGQYNYRSCEDILKVLKPLALKYGCIVKLDTRIETVGNRVYVHATANLIAFKDGDAVVSCDGYAREEETKKGMDGSQVTGAATSYARKYALAGLFGIDNEKDSDATNDHGNGGTKRTDKGDEKKASHLYKNAWLAYKEKAGEKTPDEIKANFIKLIESVTKKSDPYTLTDEEWNDVLDII